ncbi:zinc ABC transporter substrate-binding protein [Candidatus Bathyarchaeota archaeon]|nr:MAG: zinc ABC transporter substrate-binding protein [Candidatus Bathyarchaeota archaeon]
MENFKPLIISTVTVFMIVFLMGLSIQPFISQGHVEKIRVIVTILPQAEFVEKIGGERVQVSVMVPPGASPHTYEPTPKQLVEVSEADIYFQVGSGIDFESAFMDKIVKLNSKMLVVNCSKGIKIFDRDPHVWLSPRNAKKMVRNIYDALVQVDPKNREYYRRNMELYLEELDKLDREIREILKNVTNRHFMIYHPAWGYFAREYNLTQIPVEKEGKEPTVRGLMALIDQARRLKMKVIFVSPQFDRKKAETIAESIQGRIIFLDPLAKDYVDNLRSAALKIAQSMS